MSRPREEVGKRRGAAGTSILGNLSRNGYKAHGWGRSGMPVRFRAWPMKGIADDNSVYDFG